MFRFRTHDPVKVQFGNNRFDASLEVPNPFLVARIVFDHEGERFPRKGHFSRFEVDVGANRRDEVRLGDHDLFYGAVPRRFDFEHAVAQRRAIHFRFVVVAKDEDRPAQVELYREEFVEEFAVLRRVGQVRKDPDDLRPFRGVADFVQLVEEEHRVHAAAPPQAFDDVPPGAPFVRDEVAL